MRRCRTEKWIVAVGEPHNFPATYPFYERKERERERERLFRTTESFRTASLISAVNARNAAKWTLNSVKTRDSLINSMSRIGRCRVQTASSTLSRIPPAREYIAGSDCSLLSCFYPFFFSAPPGPLFYYTFVKYISRSNGNHV